MNFKGSKSLSFQLVLLKRANLMVDAVHDCNFILSRLSDKPFKISSIKNLKNLIHGPIY
jgi:hypothetical protein